MLCSSLSLLTAKGALPRRRFVRIITTCQSVEWHPRTTFARTLKDRGEGLPAPFAISTHLCRTANEDRCVLRNGVRAPAPARGGRRVPARDELRVIMSSIATDRDRLERILLRRGLGALEADRTCCADCG